MGEAQSLGYPLVRHPWLVFPDDPLTKALRLQFFLGNELLVAPVLDAEAITTKVYLPATARCGGGSWTHVWTNQTCGGAQGGTFTVATPLGRPAVFVRTRSAKGQGLASVIRGAVAAEGDVEGALTTPGA